MTTYISNLNSEDETTLASDNKTYEELIMDFALPETSRIESFLEYYETNGDEVFNIISRLCSMYNFSKSRVILNFFNTLCNETILSAPIKLEIIKAMLSCQEDEDPSSCEEDNEQIGIRNNARKNNGYQVLSMLCSNSQELVTTLRFEALCILMESELLQTEANTYFNKFVVDDNIDIQFRYKCILKLEDACSEEIKNTIGKEFKDKEFVKTFYELNKTRVQSIFPNKKIKDSDKKSWNQILFYSTYNDLYPIFINKYPNKICKKQTFIFSSMFHLFINEKTPIQFRILSGQYILQKCNCDEKNKLIVQSKLLELANDESNDYNRRADSADVLIRLGSEESKIMGRKIINRLGKLESKSESIFDNAQNVHTDELELSSIQILEHLNSIDTMRNNNNDFIDYDFVYSKIINIISNEVENSDHDKIRLALNRILIDRTLYSKFNVSLSFVLLKVWTYIHLQDENIKTEMLKRLLEELIEMADTCFSGYIVRLLNSITGFGEFNLKISWEDQIISNFAGRLNAAARNIPNNKLFTHDKINDLVELYLKCEENQKVYQELYSKSNNIHTVVQTFLETDKEIKIEASINSFLNNILIELSLSDKNYSHKPHFSLFFRSLVAQIREELYQEFKEHLSDSDFDLYMRKALIIYETGV